MLNMIRQFAGRPGHSEKVALVADLRQTVAEGLAAPEGEPATCPLSLGYATPASWYFTGIAEAA